MIKLELTLEEINFVLQKLQKFPMEEVVALVFKIKEQGDKQIKKED